jgi:GT2 family glycosyltransferase
LPAHSLSIVIVSWNTKGYLRECLQSIEPYRLLHNLEVIVVDNASSDGSSDIVRNEFPAVRLIQNDKNLGFSKANNIGIAQTSGEYIFLINSDVKLIHDCFIPMVEYMRAHPDVAVLGPRMLDTDLKVRRSTMRFPGLWNTLCRTLGLDRVFKGSVFFGGLMATDFDHSHTRDVEVLNGWFIMLRRDAMERVGLLDERFFIYGEDIDWSYRFHLQQHRRVFFADAEAIHYGGASSANAPLRFQIEMYRANSQYCEKHFGTTAQVIYLTMVWLHQLVRLPWYFALLVERTRRSEAIAKIRKSFACMSWAMQLPRRLAHK